MLRKRVRTDDSLWYFGDDCAIVGLLPGASLHVHGRFTVRVLGGQLSVVGALLSELSGVMEVNAPLCRAAFGLQCPGDATVQLASHLGLPEGYEELGQREAGCLLVLEPISTAYRSVLTKRLFRAKKGDPWLRVSAGDGSEARETFPLEWRHAVHSMSNIDGGPPVILICGKRGMGKSSFVRFAVNQLLSSWERVTLIDTDPGQPEVGPPGTVSIGQVERPLLSPGFCVAPGFAFEEAFSLLVVGTTAELDPMHFETCLKRLATRVVKLHPVVINTAGWITGLGLEMLEQCVHLFQPTSIVQLMEDVEAEVLSFGPLHTVQAMVTQVASDRRVQVPLVMTSGQLREVALSCHLGLEHALEGETWYEMSMSSICVALHDGEMMEPDMVLRALFQSVVGLIVSPSWIVRAGTYCTELPSDGVCVGMGIVRGFSEDGQLVTIQCSELVAKTILARVNVLARAGHALPFALAAADGAYTKDANLGGLGKDVMTGTKWVTRGRQ